MIDFNHVSKSFQSGSATIEIVNDAQITMAAKDTTAILGKSGSGKSTLLRMIAGLEQPDKGSIEFEGKTISTLSESQLCDHRANHIGFIFQDFKLISTLSAVENILINANTQNSSSKNLENAVELLTDLGLGERADHLPAQLSGGERQRVAIGRALIKNPALILADEPTGNLDEVTGEHIADILFKRSSNASSKLILVTHDKELAQRCQTILQLEKAHLTAVT